jgi:hypothetical protein
MSVTCRRLVDVSAPTNHFTRLPTLIIHVSVTTNQGRQNMTKLKRNTAWGRFDIGFECTSRKAVYVVTDNAPLNGRRR